MVPAHYMSSRGLSLIFCSAGSNSGDEGRSNFLYFSLQSEMISPALCRIYQDIGHTVDTYGPYHTECVLQVTNGGFRGFGEHNNP